MSSNDHHKPKKTLCPIHGPHSHDYGGKFLDLAGRIPTVHTQGLTQAERSRIHFE